MVNFLVVIGKCLSLLPLVSTPENWHIASKAPGDCILVVQKPT